MTVVTDRPLRADAARNADRILRAARDIYAELGPDAPMDAIARRAGVGERTLYRRFPTKGELARAVIDRAIAEDLAPEIDTAMRSRNPLRGIARLFDAAIALGAREHNALSAARQAGSLTDVSVQLDAALAQLTRRAQDAGLMRMDLVADDLPRMIAMLFSVLGTMDPASNGWRRYVALMIDAMSTANPTKLPRAVPIQFARTPQEWPI